jgi:hypothetical protein
MRKHSKVIWAVVITSFIAASAVSLPNILEGIAEQTRINVVDVLQP